MIKLLDLKKYSNSLTPVTSPDVFAGSMTDGDFHQNGIYSETIFGPLESKKRMTSFSYINLNAKIIHPVMLNILYRLDRNIISYISTVNYFDISKNGELITVEDGMTGLSDIIKNFDKIKFRGGTADRDRLIKLVYKSYEDGNLFIDKIPVIPPFFREIYQDKNGQWTIDELNNIYISIIRKTLSVKSQSNKDGVLSNLLFYGVQKSVNLHHEYIKKKIEKKNGLIRNKLMGKRVDFSGFGVIITEPALKSGEIGVPLRMAVALFEPFIMHLLLREGRYTIEYLTNIFNEYKEGMEVTVDNIKKILKAIQNDENIPDSLYKLIKEICEIVATKRKVIAKRDPVLLPESYQGYIPKIVEGDCIRICPIHVGGHNADFDGDTFFGNVRIYLNGEEKEIVCHIKELKDSGYFDYNIDKEKENISHYTPNTEIYIDAINIENGERAKKRITDLSEHRNISMYKIIDTKNRFDSFYVSDDHSMIIYDSIDDSYKKISPVELLKKPEGKFLIKKIRN